MDYRDCIVCETEKKSKQLGFLPTAAEVISLKTKMFIFKKRTSRIKI